MAYNDIFMVIVFSIGKKMTIMFYGWFLFRTNNLANELLVTLLGPDTCYFAALELNGPQLVESRILEEVSIDLFRLFIRFFLSH